MFGSKCVGMDYEPHREFYPPPAHYGDRRGYGGRSPPPPPYDYEGRGRRRSDSRDGGYDMGRNGRGRRSRSRSPPGHGGHPYPRQHRYSGDWGHEEGPGGTIKERPKAVSAIEPMDSYKVFMMRQDENSTPETYQQRYEEYKKKYTQRLMRAFFEDHKREEWMQERYSPAIKYRQEQQKTSKKLAEAKAFSERIRNGVAKICMDEGNGLSGKDFDNDMEDSSRILYVRRIPCACPFTSLSESIKKAGGPFQHLYLSDPVKKSAFDFDRSAYIIYETPEAAAEALPKIHNTFVEDADSFVPFRLQVSQHRSRAPLKTPSYLSVESRVSHDYQQARKLAVALDKTIFVKEVDLNKFGIEALLENEDVVSTYSTEKQKLDVTIAYLRRVHHYIYYAGTQCIDMGDILHAHPALFCRPEATQRDLDEEKERLEGTNAGDESSESKSIGGWAAGLDEKVQAYLSELEESTLAEKKEKEKALVGEIEAREEAALESTYSNYAEKAGDDGKHRCRLCTKLFKALDFVKKHIRNKHPELVVDKIAEVGESYMWEQYREDPNRPLPPIETTNHLHNPVLGAPRSNGTGSPYQGRGGPRGPYGGPPPRYRDGPGYHNRGPPPGREGRPRRGSFGGRSPPRSPPRRRERPDANLPTDPRQVTTSYQDLDNLTDTKVELAFDALESLPPPKKKTKV